MSHPCPYCPFEARSAGGLASHVRARHPEPDTSSWEEDRHCGTRTGHYEEPILSDPQFIPLPHETVTPELGKKVALITKEEAQPAPADNQEQPMLTFDEWAARVDGALHLHDGEIVEQGNRLSRLEASFAPIDEAMQDARRRQAAGAPQAPGGYSVPLGGGMGERLVSLVEAAITRFGGGGEAGPDLGASKEAIDAIAFEIAREKRIKNDTMQAWGEKLKDASRVEFEEGG